ncbi:MAG: histidine--tRNA ligase [Bacteroidota bacterium]
MDKPSLPKGTRDFGTATMAKRQFLIETIKGVFKKFGFLPLETPAMENLSTLTGKYGEEGDQLLFKILNSGDFLKDVSQDLLNSKNSKSTTSSISEKGLRYDLTVPFARYVVMNRHEITLPFKRYQIQPVWRADRPQKGRYREFYQCDADVVGTDSLICEAEIILMIKEAFSQLGIQDYTIKINHRGVLSGLAEVAGLKDNETTLFVAIDKLDKIGESGVRKELEERGVSKQSIDTVFDALNKRVIQSETAAKGFADIAKVFGYVQEYGSTLDHVEHDLQLARGLSYYTGCIFEVKINNVVIGSVSGGGRYDNLTQAFGAKEKLSGVGISFGIDRIYDAMEELKLFPEDSQSSSKVLVCCLDENYLAEGLKVLHSLRQNDIPSEVYPDNKKINKQLEYADKKSIPFALIIGSEESQSKLYTIKNLRSGEQLKKSLDGIIKLVK